MTIFNTELEFEKILKNFLDKLTPPHLISEVYDYAMFPAGKLFRPNLAMSVFCDLKNTNELDKNILYFASALECHHSYSLVHDDLPSMDNDDYRRGRLSTHKKYGEWKAILIGDGLINISYEFISKIQKIDPVRHLEIYKLFSWALGPKGLIQGQVLDLSNEMNESFNNTIETHKLKTARLIQVSMLGATLIAMPKNRNLEKMIWKHSLNIGILFQLLDDLSELCEEKLSLHEFEVSPWLKFSNETLEETIKRIKLAQDFIQKSSMPLTNKILIQYFNKMNCEFKKHEAIISTHLNTKLNLAPVMALLDSFNS